MRLHKYIANCGHASRRHAELLIQAGRVEVNGKVLTSLGSTVKSGDTIRLNGEIVRLPEPMTIAFHKPRGVITSTHDTHERLTIIDYLPRSLRERGLLPVGRLDQDTVGLLILTNLGDLNHRVTHPSYELDKEYLAVVERRPPAEAISRLERGVRIDGQTTAPARVLGVEARGRRTAITLVLHEGRKRQVRRMLEAVGHRVLELTRLRVGEVRLGTLEPGEWRQLERQELLSLSPDADKIARAWSELKSVVSQH